MRVRNTSDSPQHFTGIPTFEAGEAREVPNDVGVILLRSPFIELASSVRGIEPKQEHRRGRVVRGVEAE